MNSASDFYGSEQMRSTPAQIGLLTLAFIAVLYLGAELLIPIAFAIFISILLSPMARFLCRLHVPSALAAAVLVAALIVGITLALTSLAEPAEQWLDDAPNTIRELQQQLSSSNGKLANIQNLAEEVDQLGPVKPATDAQEVVVKGPGVLENLLGGLPTVATFAGVVIFLSFFLLSGRDQTLRTLTRFGRSWSERRRIVIIARQIQSDLSRYLITVTTINLMLGAATSLTMHLLGVPDPLMWGAVAGLLNFAPYVGALASAAILSLVGLMTFDTVIEAATVPISFLLLTILEGQLITPAIVGRRLYLSPIVVFLSVVFWGWLWGVAGALMAVPIVTVFNVFCDHIPGLRPIGLLLRNASKTESSAASTGGATQTEMVLE